jgi:hypothetical protein
MQQQGQQHAAWASMPGHECPPRFLPPRCCAAYFGVYEVLKAALAQWQGVPVSQLGPVPLMTAGGLGGAAFWVLVYPVDVSRAVGRPAAPPHMHARMCRLPLSAGYVQTRIPMSRNQTPPLLPHALLLL